MGAWDLERETLPANFVGSKITYSSAVVGSIFTTAFVVHNRAFCASTVPWVASSSDADAVTAWILGGLGAKTR